MPSDSHRDEGRTLQRANDRYTMRPSSGGRAAALILTAIALIVVLGSLAVAASKQADAMRATSVVKGIR